MPKKYSDLQRSVLTLYRGFLKFAVTKPEPLRSDIIDYAHNLWRANKNLHRSKFDRIEYLLRQESNKLDTWKESNLKNISFGSNRTKK